MRHVSLEPEVALATQQLSFYKHTPTSVMREREGMRLLTRGSERAQVLMQPSDEAEKSSF